MEMLKVNLRKIIYINIEKSLKVRNDVKKAVMFGDRLKEKQQLLEVLALVALR